MLYWLRDIIKLNQNLQPDLIVYKVLNLKMQTEICKKVKDFLMSGNKNLL